MSHSPDPEQLLLEELATLALALDPVRPPTSVRDAVLAAARKTAASNFHFVAAGAESWIPHVLRGVECKTLSIDEESDRATYLMRIQAGVTLPLHEHRVSEDCFVVDGEFELAGSRYVAGDYLRAGKGSAHGPIHCPLGCTVLLSTSVAEYREATGS